MIRVLIVEDDKLARKGLIHAMPWAQFGMQVVGEANCGQAALDFLAGAEADLVLTDFSMPGMSGCDLMRTARLAHPGLAFVVLTFHQELEYAQEAFRLGAIDYIAKIQLEKEGFDEVLGRIRSRFLERQDRAGGGAMSHNVQSSADPFGPEPGYFLLSSEEGPDLGWAESLAAEESLRLSELGPGAWLLLPAPAALESAARFAAAAGALPGWALVAVSGLAGAERGAVSAALKRYRSGRLFYDAGPGAGLASVSLDGIGGAAPAIAEEELLAIESSFLSFDWLFDDAAFSSILGRIAAAAPSPGRVSRLLVEIEGGWNRIFCPIVACRVQAPERLASWRVAESWLRGLREAASAGNRRLSYAGGVVAAVMRAASIVEAELGGQLLALDVARRVNMSRAYFCRCFKDVAGKPFNDYLQRARVERAKLLLAHTEAQVCEVAEQVGYSDEKYFAKVFREQAGVSPSAFRLDAREGRRSSSAG